MYNITVKIVVMLVSTIPHSGIYQSRWDKNAEKWASSHMMTNNYHISEHLSRLEKYNINSFLSILINSM